MVKGTERVRAMRRKGVGVVLAGLFSIAAGGVADEPPRE